MLRRCSLLGVVAGLMMTSTAGAQPGGFPGGGFPGFPAPPQPGQLLPTQLQDQLKVSPEQKKKLEELQKDADAKLATILTEEQNKSLKEMRTRPKGFGPGGGFGFGPGGFDPKKGPGGGPPGGGPPGFGPPGFGAPGGGKLDDVKKQLGATDEEWKIIGAKLQKVIAARLALSADTRGADFGFGGFGGRPGANRVTQAQTELKTVLADPMHSKAEVEDHVAAIRKARRQARTELDAAQQDLVQMLTARQETILISLGYLE